MKLLCWVEIKISLILIFLVSYTVSDIPVHCLKSQIVGKWEFHITSTKQKKVNDLYTFSCGHSVPSHESSAYKFNMNPEDFSQTIEIDLEKSDQATYVPTRELGKWTMVYDEGFEINFTDSKNTITKSFFAFSRYGRNSKESGIKSKWVSYCYSTLVGWYYENGQWGCFYGYKKGVDRNQITNGEAENKLNVVEGQVSSRDSEKSNKYYNDDNKTGVNVEADIIESSVVGEFYNKKGSTFLETKLKSELKDKLVLSASFKDHASFVERVNSGDLLWKAENYEQFSKMTVAELNHFASRNKNQSTKRHHSKFRSNSVNSLKKDKMFSFLSKRVNSLEGIPLNFDWKDKMSEARSQGSCGSCYVASTLGMLESRIRKHYPSFTQKYYPGKNNFLSLSHVLKCSVYNQGCDGGYSYLVSKFFNEFELLLEDCYDSYENKCTKKCKNENMNKIKLSVKDNQYIGGSYGKCSEEEIIKEVYANGPIVISFEPDYSFMFYKSGIYKSPTNNWFFNKGAKPEWEKVDHSVVLVGWGEEEVNNQTVKYWLLQNSWGSNWGENGFMKFVRGTDHLGIESICESSFPVLLEQN